MKNKINVNISPNPLDLQTLHCSQNDTSERKFYFTLHNNGEVIDTTDISDPIFEPFDVYKGGTEQLLPVNTDDPSTSPIIADIQYPDEEKTEQEFTYRESPTTIDGKALIEKIKGNTITWNQLAESFDVGSYGTNHAYSGTYSQADGVATVVGSNGTDFHNNTVQILANHKYLISADVKTSINELSLRFRIASVQSDNMAISADTWTQIAKILTSSADGLRAFILTSNTLTLNVKNFCIFDLTQMFGSTKADEIYAMEQSQSGSGVTYFKSLFPLPYYQYGQKLLPFNGNGIKTVGFNQWDEDWQLGYWDSNGVKQPSSNNICCSNPIPVLPNTTYYTSYNYQGGMRVFGLDANRNVISDLGYKKQTTFITPSNCAYIVWYSNASSVLRQYNNDICINISDPSKNGTYKPYTFSTLDIPTSTYFPTGMKSAGTVYDELTNSKAITRIGEVDLGSLTWAYAGTNSSEMRMYSDGINSLVKPSASTNVKGNLTCALYPNDTADATYLKQTCIAVNQTGRIFVYDPNYNTTSSPSAFKTAMNGVVLQYELAEEQVTEFTHASLICEDGESTLYQDDDSLVCECTEDFSKDSGFKDCKIKFSNDDGVVYSNKIQLHIERKP